MQLVIKKAGKEFLVNVLTEAVVGSQDPETLLYFLKKSREEGAVPDRIIGPMGGLDVCDNRAIVEILGIAEEYGVKVFAPLICPAMGVDEDGEKFALENLGQAEGALFGISHPNTDTLMYCIDQLDRVLRVGWGKQGLLVWDRDLMGILDYITSVGKFLPAIKVSIFAGVRNGIAAHWWSNYSTVSSINPTAVPAKQIAEIRRAIRPDVSIDIHFSTLNSMGARNLMETETPDGVLDFLIAAAPNVVAKFEVGEQISDLLDNARLKDYVFPRVIEQIRKFQEFVTLHTIIY